MTRRPNEGPMWDTNRRVMEMSAPKREVVIRTTVTVETRTPTTRYQYRDMSEQEILSFEGDQETDVLLEEFVKDVESTPTSELTVVRTVEIVNKQ